MGGALLKVERPEGEKERERKGGWERGGDEEGERGMCRVVRGLVGRGGNGRGNRGAEDRKRCWGL